MSLLILLAGLLALMVLMLYWKLNPFLSLCLVSIVSGFLYGMKADAILKSVQAGIASTLGSIILLLTFGAMFGKVLSVSGAADKISLVLVNKFGLKYIQWAVLITAFVVGLPMFYTAGFVILLPIVFSVATATQLPLLYIAIPMAASLSVTHGFLPPHPGPSAIAVIYKADLGLTMLYGIIIAIPAVVVSGPLWGHVVCKFTSIKKITYTETSPQNLKQELPGFINSLCTALFPICLITASAVLKYFAPHGLNLSVYQFILFAGDPTIAILTALFISMVTLRKYLPGEEGKRSAMYNDSISSIAGIVLIVASGGAFKQIMADSGVGDNIASLFHAFSLSPLLVAWSLAAVIRVALGSATVAALASAGIALPFITASTSPELMVLATGAGSLMFSHVNDAGFWIFKEYFHLSIGQTLLTWSIMETIVSLMGLGGVLLLDVFI